MIADWYEGPILESEWDEGARRYRLFLTNRGGAALAGFRLGISGPGRISSTARITGGSIVARLSNYCEIAPDPDLMLAPGATWTVEVDRFDEPIRHWTDGAAAGCVIHANGTTTPALTIPTRLTGSDRAHRRGTMRMPVPDNPPVPISILPWPRSVEIAGRRSAPDGLAIMAEDGAGEVVADNFAALTQFLFPGEGIVRDDAEGGYPVDCRFDDALGEEAYSIVFAEDGAEIVGGSERGMLYGLVTLGQMLRGARLHPQSFAFPTEGRIDDAPEMRWRGCHLDVARRLYSSEEIKQFLAVLAWNKLNVFHWHLSDDEAWRVEIDAYPELTEVAAWRGHGLAIPALLGTGPERTGGYYSKDAVRDIVDFAEDFGIDVVPEIDMPGHCYALLKALPKLVDPGEDGVYHSIQAFPNNCLNPAAGQVYGAVETILGELCELFPSRYFHVGADEVPADAWHSSPKANALREKLGVTGAAPLQAYFLKRIQAFLTARDKITGTWEEAAQGGGIDRDHCYMVGWHSVEASRRLAAEGYDVVVAPGQAYYLDMANGEDWHECGAGWAGWSSPETTYRFEPSAGWSAAERARLLGVQACIWSEPMSDRAVFDRLVFPRLSAVAETGWTPADARDFGRFTALVGLMPHLYGRYEED
jgi:hexosaminidase